MLAGGNAGAAGSVSLAWDPSPDTNVVGYALYYGLRDEGYTIRLDVQNELTATVSNLTLGLTYTFVVTAYTGEGVESLPSNEVAFLVPGAIRLGQPAQGDMAQIGFAAQAGEIISVQASDDLNHWVTLYELQPNADQTIQVFDPASAALPARYYRLRGTNAASQKILLSRKPAAHSPKISFVAQSGEWVQVQSSEDRAKWTTLYQIRAAENQWTEVVDPTSLELPMRFYRVLATGMPATPLVYLGPDALQCQLLSGRKLARLTFTNDSEEIVRLQVSEDLTNWTTRYDLGSLAASSGQEVRIIDPDSAIMPRRFYRLSGTNVDNRALTLVQTPAATWAKIRFLAPPGEFVQLQASSDLSDWATLYRLKVPTKDWYEIIDPDSCDLPRRFYRLASDVSSAVSP